MSLRGSLSGKAQFWIITCDLSLGLVAETFISSFCTNDVKNVADTRKHCERIT